jgi:hypothetical protein
MLMDGFVLSKRMAWTDPRGADLPLPPPRSLTLLIGAFPIQTHQSSTKGHRPSRGERSPVRTATAPQVKPVPLLCCVVCRAGRGRALVQCVLSAVLGLVLLAGAAAARSGSERMSGLVVQSGLSESAVPVGDGDGHPVEERYRSRPSRKRTQACSGKRRDRRITTHVGFLADTREGGCGKMFLRYARRVRAYTGRFVDAMKPRMPVSVLSTAGLDSLLLLALLVFQVSFTTQSSAAEYSAGIEIEGVLTFTTYASDGMPQSEQEHEFTLWMRDRDWKIRLIPLYVDASATPHKHAESGTDGTNVYSFVVFNPEYDPRTGTRRRMEIVDSLLQDSSQLAAADVEALRKHRLELQRELDAPRDLRRSVNQAVGTVRPGGWPAVTPGNHGAFLWLAYCSHVFLDEVADRQMPRVWPSRQPPQGSTNDFLPAAVIRADSSPRLPREIVFQGVSRQLTNAVYSTSIFTNVGTMSFPLRSSLEAFDQGFRGKTASASTLAWRYDATAVRIRPSCTISNFVPVLSVSTIIQDLRLGGVGSDHAEVQYLAPPGPWMTTTNLSELEAWGRQVVASLVLQEKRRRSIALVGLYLTVALLPCWFLVRRRGKRRLERAA